MEAAQEAIEAQREVEREAATEEDKAIAVVCALVDLEERLLREVAIQVILDETTTAQEIVQAAQETRTETKILLTAPEALLAMRDHTKTAIDHLIETKEEVLALEVAMIEEDTTITKNATITEAEATTRIEKKEILEEATMIEEMIEDRAEQTTIEATIDATIEEETIEEAEAIVETTIEETTIEETVEAQIIEEAATEETTEGGTEHRITDATILVPLPTDRTQTDAKMTTTEAVVTTKREIVTTTTKTTRICALEVRTDPWRIKLACCDLGTPLISSSNPLKPIQWKLVNKKLVK